MSNKMDEASFQNKIKYDSKDFDTNLKTEKLKAVR